VTYPQDQDYRAPGGVPATDDGYPETLEDEDDDESLGDEDLARAVPDDDDVVVERDVIVAEVIDDPDELDADGTTETGVSDDTALPSQTARDTTDAVAGSAAASGGGAATPTANAGQEHSGEQLSQQWHDIQAGFVDDPRGAVQMAAQAADAALTGLVNTLRDRQTTLGSAGTDGATDDTEILRSTLRELRQFCEDIERVGRELPQPIAGR
jgi:hypothetical protein